MSIEEAVLSLSKQMSDMQEMILKDKNEITSKLEEIEKNCKGAVNDVSDRLQVEKTKLLVMDNHLLFEVQQLQKKALDMFEKVVSVESEVGRYRATADLYQVRTIKFK